MAAKKGEEGSGPERETTSEKPRLGHEIDGPALASLHHLGAASGRNRALAWQVGVARSRCLELP